MNSCRCPLCRLAGLVRSAVRPSQRAEAAPELTLEDEVQTWSAPKLGMMMRMLRTAELLPGADREGNLAMMAAALRAKENVV